MQHKQTYPTPFSLDKIGLPASRHAAVGVLLLVALLAFELFNFDTTRYALESLLGEQLFTTISWAAILAFAFCAIDFAGLVHLFSPVSLGEQTKETYFLLGAWLLGATMNALMTWWAVTLLLVNHPLSGNQVLSHEQLLNIVPIFVAVLVWLIRILFIGAISVAGEHLFGSRAAGETAPSLSKTAISHHIPSASGRKPAGMSASSRIQADNNEMPSFITRRPDRGNGHGSGSRTQHGLKSRNVRQAPLTVGMPPRMVARAARR